MKAFLLMLEKGSLLKIAKDRLVYILFFMAETFIHRHRISKYQSWTTSYLYVYLIAICNISISSTYP